MCIASYFSQIDFNIEKPDEYYKHAIELLKKDKADRDNGIAQLLCLWRNNKIDKYQDNISEYLWGNNVEEFPKSDSFYEMIWEELPHPKDVNFGKLYKKFIFDGLSNDIFKHDIFRYINLFYLTSLLSGSKYTKIEFTNRQLQDMLNSIENELNEEKNNEQGVSFYRGESKSQKIRYISEFIAMVYVLKIDDEEADGIIQVTNGILELIKDLGANGIAMEVIKLAVENKYSEACDKIIPAFWSNDEKSISEASLGLHLIYYIAKKNNHDVMTIKNCMLEIMEKLQYSDIKYVKSIWNLLRETMLIVLSDDKELQKNVAKIYKNCIQSYSYKGLKGDKYYFEAMFNCNRTLKSYVERVEADGNEIGNEIKDVIEYVNSLNVPELTSIWE